jgi:hypothetical protein
LWIDFIFSIFTNERCEGSFRFYSDSDFLLRELKFIKPIFSHPRLLFRRKIRKMPAHSVSLREPEQVAPFHFINIDDYTGVSAA